MKTSNIILTVFSILFIVYVFGIAAEIRFKGEKTPPYLDNNVPKNPGDCTSDYSLNIVLPSFKILKLNRISKVGNIKFNDQARNIFSVYSANEAGLPEIKYYTSGDTLFIEKMNKEGLCNEFTLELTEPPQQIIADTMRVNLVSSSGSLKSLNLKGSNSIFQLLTVNNSIGAIDSLTVNLDNDSSIYSQTLVSINRLEGKALNNSKILIRYSKVESANIEVGRESQIMINGQFYNNTDPSVKLIYQKTKQENN